MIINVNKMEQKPQVNQQTLDSILNCATQLKEEGKDRLSANALKLAEQYKFGTTNQYLGLDTLSDLEEEITEVDKAIWETFTFNKDDHARIARKFYRLQQRIENYKGDLPGEKLIKESFNELVKKAYDKSVSDLQKYIEHYCRDYDKVFEKLETARQFALIGGVTLPSETILDMLSKIYNNKQIILYNREENSHIVYSVINHYMLDKIKELPEEVVDLFRNRKWTELKLEPPEQVERKRLGYYSIF